MTVRAVETVVVAVNHRGNWVFVQVVSDQGLVGLGEASHSGNDRLVADTVAAMAETLVGKPVPAPGAFAQQARSRKAGFVHSTAVSALEQALWDLLGQSLGVPAHHLLGGQVRDRIRLYANVNRTVTDRSPAGFAAAAAAAVADGFDAVKLAPFDEVRPEPQAHTGAAAVWRPGVARVAAVRDAVGASVEVAVDCHGRMAPAQALAVARALEPHDVLWLEEPVPVEQVSGLRAVTARAPMQTASCESLVGIEAFAPFLTERVVDVLMPDVKHVGGIGETKAIAEAARINQSLVAPHNPAGPVATAASAQAMSTTANFLILEYAYGEVPWRAELLDPPEQIEHGALLLPTGPGLGHRLNAAVVERHRTVP